MKWASCDNTPRAGTASFEQISSGEGLCATWGNVLLANTESRPRLDMVVDGQGALARVGGWLGPVEGWRRYYSSKPWTNDKG